MARAILNNRYRRLVLLIFLLALFLQPWPEVGRLYTSGLAWFGNWGMSQPTRSATLHFVGSGVSVPRPFELLVLAQDSITGRSIRSSHDVQRGGYISSALFAALVLASAGRRSSRAAVLLLGLVAIQTLLLMLVRSYILHKALGSTAEAGGPVTAPWSSELLYRVFMTAPGMAYAVPILLWVMLMWIFDPAAVRLGFWSPRERGGSSGGA